MTYLVFSGKCVAYDTRSTWVCSAPLGCRPWTGSWPCPGGTWCPDTTPHLSSVQPSHSPTSSTSPPSTGCFWKVTIINIFNLILYFTFIFKLSKTRKCITGMIMFKLLHNILHKNCVKLKYDIFWFHNFKLKITLLLILELLNKIRQSTGDGRVGAVPSNPVFDIL